jgi:hypothetical protein
MPECWPNDWILHHDNASAHMVLSVKYFLAQELITEMKYPYSFPDLAPSDFWLFSKINSNLKR